MAIRINLDLMLLRRSMTLSDLAERVGITLPNLSVLKTGKARAIRFTTLEALCRELSCQPGDLLEYVPERTTQAEDENEPEQQPPKGDQPLDRGPSRTGKRDPSRRMA